MQEVSAHRKTFGLLLLLPFVAVAACEVEPDPEAIDPAAETPAPAPGEVAPDPGPPDPQMEHSVISLAPVDGSGVQGEALAMHEEDSVILVIEVTGLPAEGEYAAHIHEGTCAGGGPVAVGLTPVAGAPDGSGSSTTALEAGELDPDQPAFVQVHSQDGPPIACGDIEGHG